MPRPIPPPLHELMTAKIRVHELNLKNWELQMEANLRCHCRRHCGRDTRHIIADKATVVDFAVHSACDDGIKIGRMPKEIAAA